MVISIHSLNTIAQMLHVWNIYLHEWLQIMINVGTSVIHSAHMGRSYHPKFGISNAKNFLKVINLNLSKKLGKKAVMSHQSPK